MPDVRDDAAGAQVVDSFVAVGSARADRFVARDALVDDNSLRLEHGGLTIEDTRDLRD